MWALTVAAIYLIPFIVLGWLAKRLAGRWMAGKGLDLSGLSGQMGRNRGRRQRFLLGAWWTERDP